MGIFFQNKNADFVPTEQYIPQDYGPSDSALPPENPYLDRTRAFSFDQKEEQFLKAVYEFDKGVERLEHVWNGDVMRGGEWHVNKDPSKAIMNREGIMWAVTKLQSYTGNNYIMTAFDDKEINNMMYQIGTNLITELSVRRKHFGFKHNLDIESVYSDMLYFIFSILKGAYRNAQRQVITTTNKQVSSISETRDGRPGFFSRGNNGSVQGGGLI